MNKGGESIVSFPSNYNTMLLVIEGEIKVNETEFVATNQVALFENEGETIQINATEHAVVLVMSGEPIKEAIAAQGPFVMNTRDELRQAIDDYNMGKFGYLED